jgi:hypothetical protein
MASIALRVYHWFMDGRTTKSLLDYQPKLMDEPDVIVSAGDLRDISDDMRKTLMHLDGVVVHPQGKLSLYEETIVSRHFKGWILRAERSDTDVALGYDISANACTFQISGWHYVQSPGSIDYPETAELAVPIPYMRETYFITERPELNFVALGVVAVHNMPFYSPDFDALAPDVENEFQEISESLTDFTLYSLHKVGKLMSQLNGEGRLAE